MGRKRFKDQILALILEVCAGERKRKTQIVYNSNMKEDEALILERSETRLIELFSWALKL